MKKYLLPLIASSIIALFFGVLQAQAAITLKNSCTNSQNGSQTKLGCSLGTVTAGDFIVVMEETGTSSSSVITDKGGDTFTSSSIQLFNGNDYEAVWYSANVAGGTTYNVTSTFGAASTFVNLFAAEYSGIVTASPLDGATSTATSGHGSGILSSGTSTQANAPDLIVGASNCNDSSGVITIGSGWTSLNTSGGQCVVDEATTTATTGNHSAWFNISNSGDNTVASMAAFKGTPAAATSTPTSDVTVTNGVTLRGGVTIR